MPTLYFSWRDTTLHLRNDKVPADLGLFQGCLAILEGLGFVFQTDPNTHVADLATDHHRYGSWKGCEVVGDFSDRCFHITFFQNMVFTNSSGGRYDYQKREKMPFLTRMRFQLVRRRLSEFLRKQGLVEEVTPGELDGLDRLTYYTYTRHGGSQVRLTAETVRDHRHLLLTYKPHPLSPDAKDRDGELIVPGTRKYFYNGKGGLCTGIVYYHINNMWWVYCPAVFNMSNYELFDPSPGALRRRPCSPEQQMRVLKAQLDKRLKGMDYERCIPLRDALFRLGYSPYGSIPE